MASLNFTLVAFCVIAAFFCQAIPRPYADKATKDLNTAIHNDISRTPYWLRFALDSAKQEVPNNNIQQNADNAVDSVNKIDQTLQFAEDYLPVLIHKEEEDSGIKLTPSPLSAPDNVNPFVRSKRSACSTPANLPQLVRDLNTRLSASQFVGLNPGESTASATPVNQYTQCPSSSNNWWPQPQVNLRSTCPWYNEQTDLGVDAFPRYINKAVCMCSNGCINAQTMMCKEVTQNVTIFYRRGCENGLAIMEAATYEATIGCHCASGGSQVPDQISE